MQIEKNVLHGNMNVLQQVQPEAYQKLVAHLDGSRPGQYRGVDKILVAREEDRVINLAAANGGKNYLLCDHEDPITEAYRWIDKYIDPVVPMEVVFGMGFAYHIEVLAASFPHKKIFVIEPDMELFRQLISIRNLEELWPRITLILDENPGNVMDRLVPLFWEAGSGGMQVQPFEVYTYIFDAYWTELTDTFIKHIQSLQVDIATRKALADRWLYNNVRNADKIAEAADAGALCNQFKGIPGIVVSAGPSLSKNMHLLQDLKERCVLIAAGTAVKVLEENGIPPHFMMGIDASEGEARLHQQVKNQDIFFLYSNQVAPGSLEGYHGRKFLMNYGPDQYTRGLLEHAKTESEILFSGPSVANTCFDMLYRMGCDPIILVGQDLALTDGKNYAGPSDDRDMQDDISRHPELHYILAKDINGNDTYTTEAYLSMRNWFEGYFSHIYDKVRIINATEGGLPIAHARHMPLSEAVQQLPGQSLCIAERIAAIYADNLWESREIQSALDEYKSQLLHQLQEMQNKMDQQKSLTARLSMIPHTSAGHRQSFAKLAAKIGALQDEVLQMEIYTKLLAAVVHIDFYLIKSEMDRMLSQASGYDEIQQLYLDAWHQQHQILQSQVDKLQQWIAEGGVCRYENY